MTERRFPRSWSVDGIGAALVIKDGNGQKLAYIYFEEEPGRAARYLQPKVSAVEATKADQPSPPETYGIRVEFVKPRPRPEPDDENGECRTRSPCINGYRQSIVTQHGLLRLRN